MDDQTRKGAPETEPEASSQNQPEAEADRQDVEGHSATIYRRRRGPYPLRHGAALPDADDRRRGERHPPAHRAVA